MAANQTILKSSVNTAIVKVAGSGSTTIVLSSLAASDEQVSGTPTVNILGVSWTGAVGAFFTITRNGVIIISGPCDQPFEMNFAGNGFTDSVGNTSDLVVNITGGESQIYITLRKVGGFSLA